MKTKTWTVIKTDGSIEALTTTDKTQLEQLQKAVEGYIEGTQVRYQNRLRRAYVNEEGLLKGLPQNALFPQYVGNVVVRT